MWPSGWWRTWLGEDDFRESARGDISNGVLTYSSRTRTICCWHSRARSARWRGALHPTGPAGAVCERLAVPSARRRSGAGAARDLPAAAPLSLQATLIRRSRLACARSSPKRPRTLLRPARAMARERLSSATHADRPHAATVSFGLTIGRPRSHHVPAAEAAISFWAT